MRRALPRIALAALLGALTCIASALAIAVWMPFEMYPRHAAYHFIADGRPWSAAGRTARGVLHLWWSELNEADMFPPPPPKQVMQDTLRALIDGTPEKPPRRDVPSTPQGWVDLARRQVEESNADPSRVRSLRLPDGAPGWGTFAGGGSAARGVSVGTDHGFGWPLPALWYRVHGTYMRNLSMATGIEGGRLVTGKESLAVRGYDFRALPYFVHWPGLVTNTAIFAATWASLLFAPETLRRAFRRHRGCCPACGYSRAGVPTQAPCPECGRVLPDPGRESTSRAANRSG